MAKILYTKQGNDPTTITHPDTGPPSDRITITSGTPLVVNNLIGYGDGTITYPDGRLFPPVTKQGSTLAHQKT